MLFYKIRDHTTLRRMFTIETVKEKGEIELANWLADWLGDHVSSSALFIRES